MGNKNLLPSVHWFRKCHLTHSSFVVKHLEKKNQLNTSNTYALSFMQSVDNSLSNPHRKDQSHLNAPLSYSDVSSYLLEQPIMHDSIPSNWYAKSSDSIENKDVKDEGNPNFREAAVQQPYKGSALQR